MRSGEAWVVDLAEGVDADADRLRMADGVGELHFALGSEVGGDIVWLRGQP